MNLPQLYFITDRKLAPRRSLDLAVSRALERGARLIQLREKEMPTEKLAPLARKLQKICKKHRARLLLNSHLDLAVALNLDGVHFPASQLDTLAKARSLLGPHKLIGASAHSLTEARAAARAGADFITFGPIFATPSKKKYGSPLGLRQLEQVCRKIKIPVYALGGLRLEHLPIVRRLGAHGLAAIRAFIR